LEIRLLPGGKRTFIELTTPPGGLNTASDISAQYLLRTRQEETTQVATKKSFVIMSMCFKLTPLATFKKNFAGSMYRHSLR